MVTPEAECTRQPGERPRHEVADIFRAHGEAYRSTHVLTPAQRKVMWALEACRTAQLGGHLDQCSDCGHERPSYNSCGNRHCPKCQGLVQAKWLERRMAHILPVHYFHVVFTLPAQLRPLGLANQKLFYDLLFRAASQTLLTLGRDPERLGAQLGFTAVLHTWARDLSFHPHLHCIVTGGGLSDSGEAWVDAGGRYLFPVEVLGKLFRGKFLDALDAAHRKQQLIHVEAPAAFGPLMTKLYGKAWVVYAKRPFAGPEQVYSYLGRYTHRVGLSNRRLLNVTDDAVELATRDGKSIELAPQEFIRRFLLHVLPDGYVTIRHYGLLAASNLETRLRTARTVLEAQESRLTKSGVATAVAAGGETANLPLDWRDHLARLTGIDLRVCPMCGCQGMRTIFGELRPVPLQAALTTSCLPIPRLDGAHLLAPRSNDRAPRRPRPARLPTAPVAKNHIAPRL